MGNVVSSLGTFLNEEPLLVFKPAKTAGIKSNSVQGIQSGGMVVMMTNSISAINEQFPAYLIPP